MLRSSLAVLVVQRREGAGAPPGCRSRGSCCSLRSSSVSARARLTLLIVEQNVRQVLRVVDRAYLLDAGTIRASAAAGELSANKAIQEAYLGV
jgi:ABC-type thiamine transport system ATPase subunit